MIDPIKKLRECWLLNPVSGLKPFEYEIGDVLADEIEAVYMKFPMDANGMPIRPGDTVECDTFGGGECIVMAVARDFWVDIDGFTHKPEVTRHVKPDTVESLLQELADEVWNASCVSQTTWSDSGLDGIVGRYAERIREAVDHE